MIHVKIKRNGSGRIQSFSMNGHANYAQHGQDIVCAGASAISFGTVNAIIALADITPEIKQNNGGYLQCEFPENLSQEKDEKVQLLLEGMVISLQTIERDYSKYIKITFQK